MIFNLKFLLFLIKIKNYYKKSVAKTIFGKSEEMLLNSFMEKVEKNLLSNNIGKNVISANKILELTLEDYHESRKIYDNNKDTKNMTNKILQNSVEGVSDEDNSNINQQMQNMEINNPQDLNNNNDMSNQNNQGEMYNENNNMNNEGGENQKVDDVFPMMKNLTFEFIKERELEG